MPSEMIERIARALWAEREKTMPEHVRQRFEARMHDMDYDLARALIRAMREPTGLMLSHGDAVIPSGFHWARDGHHSGTQEIYTAMIDAALKEPEKG